MTAGTSEDKLPLLNDEESDVQNSSQPQTTTAVSTEQISGELRNETTQGS